MGTAQELVEQWKLVENHEGAKKMMERLGKTESEGTDERIGILKIKCEIRMGALKDHYALQEKVDSLFPEKSDSVLQSIHHLLAMFHLFGDKNLDKARDNIRKAMAFAETDMEDTLLSAQILIAKGQRQLANTQLVNAAKEASTDWRIFYWLSENLIATKVLGKARICVEHARKLNPSSELCAQLLDRILIETGSTDSDRLDTLLQFLGHRPNSLWALRQAAILEINAGQLEPAVDKCQRVIRLMTNAFGECPEEPKHRQELCAMWTFVSEAYRQKGNLQSALRACKAVLELDPINYTAKLQLIQLYQGMCQYGDAITLGQKVENELGNNSDTDEDKDSTAFPRSLLTHFRTLHLHSLVLHLCDPEMRRGYFIPSHLELLPEIFARIKKLLSDGNNNSSSILLHKCLAQSLKIIQGFNNFTFRECLRLTGLNKSTVEGGWGIGSRSGLARLRIHCLATVLQANRNVADSWNDLGMAFLDAHLMGRRNNQEGGGRNLLESAIKCLQSAIRMTCSKLKRSEFYCNLGRAFLAKGNASRSQHCFVRAKQLNRHCDSAWTLLSLLYLQLGLNDEALAAMDNAQKINPSSSEAWCSHAIHAERTNHFDTMDLYRHVIVLKPSTFAVQKYCHFVMEFQRQRKHLDEGTMINFELLKNLYHTAEPTPQLLHAVACLAENFWYLEEAKEYICGIKMAEMGEEMARNRERIRIKAGMDSDEQQNFPETGLKALRMLYNGTTDSIYARLQQFSPVRELLSAIASGDASVFSHHYHPSMFPLLATTALTFNLTIPPQNFAAIESVRPLHKLFDVFSALRGYQMEKPPLAPHEEEAVLVRHDHLTEHLHTLLKLLTTKDNEKNDEKKAVEDGFG